MAKILIVDDEPHIRLLLGQSLEELEDRGIELHYAENGEAALEIISGEKPELVFLDVMMPKINGFEVCNTVKNKYCMKDISVILLTAKGQEFDKEQGIKAGADAYITKPFNPDEILEKAYKILKIEK